MKELTKEEVRQIVFKVVDELKLKEIYIPDVVRSAIYVSVGEITNWDESETPMTSLYDEEIELYASPSWGEKRPEWVFEEEDYDFRFHYETVEEAVYYGARSILEQQVEGEEKLKDEK